MTSRQGTPEDADRLGIPRSTYVVSSTPRATVKPIPVKPTAPVAGVFIGADDEWYVADPDRPSKVETTNGQSNNRIATGGR
jgi:hypothetical protein